MDNYFLSNKSNGVMLYYFWRLEILKDIFLYLGWDEGYGNNIDKCVCE